LIGIRVYIQTAEPSDFTNVEQANFLLLDFVINESYFTTIPENSIVVLDDFSFKEANNKQAKLEFLKVINYVLRHKKIRLVLVVHNLFNTNLSNDILFAPHIFLSYSNMGYSLMRF
jgi:ribosomal protein L4